MLRRFPEVRSIHWAINDTPAEVTNLPTVLLWGEDAIEEEILGLRFRVRPNAFLQTNTEMAETLYSIARDFAGLTGGETVYDLYCGTGTIGLALASQALTVWGVEISEESVACAIENAELNEISNAAFFAGNVSLALEELLERAGPPDVVVVDPPRAGLAGKALRRMARLQAPRIVYVSCNPTTLASDLKTLREDFGYELRRCVPVDMFPHTPHIESVNLLELGRGSRLSPADGPRPSSKPHPSPGSSRPRSRQRRQSRSAFGSRKPKAIAGRAGRPLKSNTVVRIRVSESSPTIAEPGPGHPEPEARGRGEEEGEEEDVRRPDVRRTVLTREPERDRDAIEQARLLRDDVARRPSPDRERVDPRDDDGDQHDPGERLERLHEQEPDRGQGEELRDVEQRPETDEVEARKARATRITASTTTRSARRDGEHEPRHREGDGEDDEGGDQDVGPEPDVREHARPGIPGDRAPRERRRDPQRGGGSVRR